MSLVYKRNQRERAIKRKMQICSNLGIKEGYAHIPGKLNKGKIHCSCPLCSNKTKHAGVKYNFSRRDQRTIYNMHEQIITMEV